METLETHFTGDYQECDVFLPIRKKKRGMDLDKLRTVLNSSTEPKAKQQEGQPLTSSPGAPAPTPFPILL